MEMAPARTGSDSSSRKAVTSTDHANSGILWMVMPGARMLKMVVMKLTGPVIDEAPAMCSDRIAKSTAGPGWPDAPLPESGGYSVQPEPTPPTNIEHNSRMKAGGSSQNEMLF